ncbi:hypothetical protein ACJJTC_003358 [Scirpophaga incertulas]
MPPKKTTPSPASTSGRSMDNPTEEASRRNITNLTEPTSLSFDRTSGSVRDHVIEGGGESPAPMQRIMILEDIRILPARTTMDLQQQQQTPVHPKTERAPRMVKMPSESPASPEEDEFRTPTRTPTLRRHHNNRNRAPRRQRPRSCVPRRLARSVRPAQARPAGSAREACAAPAKLRPATPRASARIARARPVGSAREAASRDASRERATASAADVMALLGRTVAADANIENPRKPPAPHLAARMGTTTTPIETKAMVAMKISNTKCAAEYASYTGDHQAASRRDPPDPDRSADSTPDRSGLLPATGPPLNEPRALVSAPTPGCGPNAPTPFSSTHTTMETPRATTKRAREEGEEGDSGKRNPAVRPKTDPSPASQKLQEDLQIPSTSYAERVRSTHITIEKMDSYRYRHS